MRARSRRRCLSQQVETAQFLGAAGRTKLAGELVCYGRSVVHAEGRARSPTARATRSTRGESACSRTWRRFSPQTPSQEAAYGKWLDQTSDREDGAASTGSTARSA